jgi:hypothetical protein
VTDLSHDLDTFSGDHPSRDRKPSPADPMGAERMRLAQLVGHLLARRWLLGRAMPGPASCDDDETGAGQSGRSRAEGPDPRI